jgi:hypothetical protein
MSAFFRALPVATYLPLRICMTRLPRWHLLRGAYLVALRPVINAYRLRLSEHLTEYRPLHAPQIVLSVTKDQNAETVYWFGVQVYEGMVADVWRALCARSQSILEIAATSACSR